MWIVKEKTLFVKTYIFTKSMQETTVAAKPLETLIFRDIF